MNNRNLMYGLLSGFVVALVMVVPVSATTTTKIDFENVDFVCNEDIIEPYYSVNGLTFTGAQSNGPLCQGYLVSNYPPHSGNWIIYNLGGSNIRIDFASPVSRVSIWYTAFTSGNIEAYNSQNQKIDSDSGSANIGSYSKLEVIGPNIAYVVLHDAGNQITYDDLEYDTETAIPEFPTVAIPVISVIGLVFLINRRKN